MNLGLALSGGGAKGAAHIGVLKAFEEEKIKTEKFSKKYIQNNGEARKYIDELIV